MFKLMNKFNKWYDSLPEPKRFLILIIPMIMVTVIAITLNHVQDDLGNYVLYGFLALLILVRMIGK